LLFYFKDVRRKFSVQTSVCFPAAKRDGKGTPKRELETLNIFSQLWTFAAQTLYVS
jgi:hypothetical protein